MDSSRGFTLLEVLVVIALSAVLYAVGILAYSELYNPMGNSEALVIGVLRQSRAEAMSKTTAVLITPVSSTVATVSQGANCSSGDWEELPNSALRLPKGVRFDGVGWEVCFSSRGLSDDNIYISLLDEEGKRSTVEVMLGGGARVL